MQTFLPYPSFEKSAQVLDNKRLNKQIVECYQIFRAITNPSYGWQNHPIVNMWRGYPDALLDYQKKCATEFEIVTGNIHKSYDQSIRLYIGLFNKLPEIIKNYPPWIGYEPFHLSHRINLIRKDPNYYIPLFYGFSTEEEKARLREISLTWDYLWFDERWYTIKKGKRTYVTI